MLPPLEILEWSFLFKRLLVPLSNLQARQELVKVSEFFLRRRNTTSFEFGDNVWSEGVFENLFKEESVGDKDEFQS